MIGFALLLFPFVLLGFVMLMGRVEEPLIQIAEERDIEQFLDDANAEELDAFVRAVADARAMPIPLESLVATTLATFAAGRSLASRRLEAVVREGSAAAGAGLADDGGART